nr:uncharacterized protein LOC129454122 [Misgurnus anguillicaudatus]
MDIINTDSASEARDLPEKLVALYDANMRDLCQNDLQKKCEEIFIRLATELTYEQCVNLERATKEQANSQDWHKYRIGRITSTTLYHVCTANETEKTDLVEKIMQYNQQDLSHVPAVNWGKNNEDIARKQYIKEMKAKHQNFNVDLCGLVMLPGNPHLGASPDGIANCTCCGKVAVEIKCPYKYREGLKGISEDPYFCLDENFQLKKAHQYYHQVQLHMFVCNVQSCDFVVWTEKEVQICRIARDEEMLQAVLPKAEVFFKQRVLPELLTHSMDTRDPSGSKP